ncbi:MAG: hypothetical protein ABR502_01835 [Chitinophagaceae bacterium]
MSEQNQHLEALEDIKQLMHKSSRFISLSGWSGIAAGCCALAAAVYTATRIECWRRGDCEFERIIDDGSLNLKSTLLFVALVTFFVASTLAFLFTYLRSKKNGVPIWGHTARRVLINVAVPMIVGGVFIWRMMDIGFYGLIAPACLIFYGLGLINASKYTLPEVRYLGYGQLIFGIINLWMIGYGLYFWAAGFGVLHIIYGIVMWNRYERNINAVG